MPVQEPLHVFADVNMSIGFKCVLGPPNLAKGPKSLQLGSEDPQTPTATTLYCTRSPFRNSRSHMDTWMEAGAESIQTSHPVNSPPTHLSKGQQQSKIRQGTVLST
eukprot:TRINITY_DN7729_c0_g1_i1.p1 TRINITY_DN7729_c0_g1~~TRINITY_DN7729_c0_g1_i1.p1  ORF type:complete len:106 (+),score=9.82 TRINITY_DN7729_c0_g1_i1:112-429(+)